MKRAQRILANIHETVKKNTQTHLDLNPQYLAQWKGLLRLGYRLNHMANHTGKCMKLQKCKKGNYKWDSFSALTKFNDRD